MIITPENYPSYALRTNNTLAGTYGNVPPDLIHAVLGVYDELREYETATTKINKLEELGDLLWFLQLAAVVVERETGFSVWDAALDELTEFPDQLSKTDDWKFCLQDLAGLVKKPYAYGTGKAIPWEEISEAIRHGVVKVATLAWIDGDYTLQQIMQQNIEKLYARFPEKFTEDAAYNRDLAAEDNALRKAFGISMSEAHWQKLESFVQGSKAWRIARHPEERDKCISELMDDGCRLDSKFLGESIWVVAQWRNEFR